MRQSERDSLKKGKMKANFKKKKGKNKENSRKNSFLF